MSGSLRPTDDDSYAVLLVSGVSNSTLPNEFTNGSLDLVKYLVEKVNVDVNLEVDCVQYSFGKALLRVGPFNTAFSAAIAKRFSDIVELLVEEGNANINLKLTWGRIQNFGSVLDCAIGRRSADYLEYLVPHKTADVNIRHLQGPYANPLNRAIFEAYEEGVRILLSAGASADLDGITDRIAFKGLDSRLGAVRPWAWVSIGSV
ncbi:hypothetical protein BDV27DRAFT_163627 [Aspergillus caelatus]|uniref:Uncharacterized protein n=1 Tax=Aspergillus caelatus TaxID=61420 RepID=A0A5N6ZLA5_9EURO|nr:uncharacterized protein BDV27DRAFT_163627 [Aspergillus caelatus]KAE8358397.1 hypothetical protein BDV27DRAFT_163627 [Aspergillus caelatus]